VEDLLLLQPPADDVRIECDVLVVFAVPFVGAKMLAESVATEGIFSE
jgi:hypothetical protein